MYQRLLRAITFQSIGIEVFEKPDLFNPLWIDLTLAFFLSVVGNLSTFFQKTENFHFDFAFVSKSFALVIGLGIIIPALITLAFFFYGLKTSLKSTIGIIAIYNYTNLFFIIGSLFYLVPIQWVGFLLLSAFACLSALSLILNYSQFIDQYKQEGKKTVVILIILLQALAMLAYKFGFFT